MLQKSHFNLRFPFAYLVFAGMFSLILWSCQSQGHKKEKEISADSKSIELHCTILKKEQIQQWVDKGWTDPANPKDSLIRKIMVQFYSADASAAAANMQLVTYPARNYTMVYGDGRADAEIDPTCTALIPEGKAIFANNFVSLKDLGIIKQDGSLIDFTFLRFRPVQERATRGEYITFVTEVVKVSTDNLETVLDMDKSSDPCPIICNEDPEP